MKHIIFSFLMAATVGLVGCSRDSSADNPVTTSAELDKTNAESRTTYQYTGLGRDGSVVVRGTITLSVSAVGRVTGRWELRGLDPGRIGPQVGTGTLVGSLDNGSLFVNLNPENADNNVLLNGRLSRTEYVGRWEWVGFRGTINGGTFRGARSRTASERFSD